MLSGFGHIPKYPVSLILLILSCYLCIDLQVIYFLQLSDQNFALISLSICPCYMLCLFHPIHLIFGDTDSTQLLSLQFSPAFYEFLPILIQIFCSTLSSNSISLCLSLTVRSQVSRLYKTTGKLTDLNILLFTLLGDRLQDKRC
jgi:hypothetical protein